MPNIEGRPICHSGGWSPGFNFDGFICQTNGADQKCHSYLQVFRNGCIEAVDNVLLHPRENDRKCFFESLEAEVAEAMKRFLGLLSHLDVVPPFFAMLSFLNVKGYFMLRNVPPTFIHGHVLDREQLVFPEEMVTSHDTDCFRLLKRSFDMLWQACGYEQSPNYDREGNRKGRRN